MVEITKLSEKDPLCIIKKGEKSGYNLDKDSDYETNILEIKRGRKSKKKVNKCSSTQKFYLLSASISMYIEK